MSSLPWQRSVTTWVLIIVPLLLVAWDVVAETTSPGNATISEVTINFAYRHPVLWWLMGCLLAHLSWPVAETRPHWQTIIVVVLTIAVAIWLDLMGWVPAMMPVLPLVLGLPCGHLLWPQKVATETGATLLVQSTTAPSTMQTRTLTTILPPPPKPGGAP